MTAAPAADRTPIDVTRYIKGTHCPVCQGRGDTAATRTVVGRATPDAPLRTVFQGSGCPECYGNGKVKK